MSNPNSGEGVGANIYMNIFAYICSVYVCLCILVLAYLYIYMYVDRCVCIVASKG